MESNEFYNKYRPKTLERIIGHEKQVTRLQGIIKSGKCPSALMFVGPSSAGKTTLARAFASKFYEDKYVMDGGARDYLEINCGVNGKVEEVRDMLKVARLRPQVGTKRIIVLDEAQKLTGSSESAILKPLETAPPSTIFILCSMEPEKLDVAIKNRCSMFVLEPPRKEDLTKFAKRIVKGESMEYVDEASIPKIVENSNGEYRTCANIIEALWQYVEGLEKRPKKLDEEDIEAALATTEANDELLAVKVMAAMYSRNFSVCHRCIMDIVEPFRFINTMLRLNTFLLNSQVLAGEKHKSVWFSKQNTDLMTYFKTKTKEMDDRTKLKILAIAQTHLTRLKIQSSGFLVPEVNLISSTAFEAINEIRANVKAS